MRRTAAGDPDAFGELVDRYHQVALNLAYRMTGDPEHAKDVVQESFLRILKAARRYEPRGKFTTYLYTVVRNLVFETDRQRRRRREEPIGPDGEGDRVSLSSPFVPPPPAAPDAELELSDLRDRLLGALRNLDEELRTVFVLSEIEGLSYREIAEICNCPIGTVGSRKHAAVMRLRAILKPLRNRP